MQKRAYRGLFIIALITLLFVLTSCGNRVGAGENPPDTAAALREVQTGTLGVETRLIDDMPPSIIYDDNELVAIAEVRNRGNHPLLAQDCFVTPTGFDTNIIPGLATQSCATNLGELEGKTVYSLEGGFNQLEFRSPIVLPPDVPEYNPRLNFITCYDYHTIANPEVCVDPQFYQVTSEQKACRPQSVSVSGGQGAPVGVSYVGVNMVGDKAIFEINVKNFGDGQILHPATDLQSCADGIQYTDLDKVEFDVHLSGGSLVNCKPNDRIVRMNNGNGKIVCTFNVQGTSAFTSPLLIDLFYHYMDRFEKTIKIVDTPGP